MCRGSRPWLIHSKQQHPSPCSTNSRLALQDLPFRWSSPAPCPIPQQVNTADSGPYCRRVCRRGKVVRGRRRWRSSAGAAGFWAFTYAFAQQSPSAAVLASARKDSHRPPLPSCLQLSGNVVITARKFSASLFLCLPSTPPPSSHPPLPAYAA